MSDDQTPRQDRRTFLKRLSAVAATATLTPATGATEADRSPPTSATTMIDHVAERLERLRVGLVGTGERGSVLLRLLLQIPDVDVLAICDVDPVSLDDARARIRESGRKGIDIYSGDDYAYRDMLDRADLDAVFIATPWRWHAPMATDTMRAGKHAFVEVPLATTLQDLWEIVDTSESTRRHCMMMENVCYGRDEMMVLNMVQQGLLGELTHGEGAYIHDLRWQMKEIERKTGSWRTYYHTTMRGNIYPTHGLGPIAQYMGINRRDRFDYMTSVSSPALGRAAYARREFPPDHERNRLKYIKGDMNSTLIKTVQGRSILVQYDTTTARPYSRLNLVQGTGGAFAGFPSRIALENPPPSVQAGYEAAHAEAMQTWAGAGRQGPEPRPHSYHEWDLDMDKWYRLYDHPLWVSMKTAVEEAGGHGGMDFVMLSRIVQCLRDGLPLDQSVYDGAAWSSLFPLSHESVVNRSRPVDIPDFTRGAWRRET